MAAANSNDARARALLLAYSSEVRGRGGHFWLVEPTAYGSGRLLLAAPPPVQIAAVHALIEAMEPRNPASRDWYAAHPAAAAWAARFLCDPFALDGVLFGLLALGLPLGEDDVHRILDRFAACDRRGFGFDRLRAVLRAVEVWAADAEVPPAVAADLERLRAPLAGERPSADGRRTLATIARLLGEPVPPPEPIDANDDWGSHARAALDAMLPAERTRWLELMAHAATATTTRPSGPWQKRGRQRIDAVGGERFAATAVTWLGLLNQRARHPARPRDADATGTPALLADRNATLLRGLVWCCGPVDDAAIAQALGDAAEGSYKQVPQVGTRSAKVGNACVWALGAMPGPHGLVHLQRLRQRVAYASARALIDGTLEAAAGRSGLSREDLDDLAVPTYGLVDGRRRVELEPYAAEIAVARPRRIELRWFGADGTSRRSEPAETKRRYPDEIKALKREVADLRTILPAQRDRIVRLLVGERAWRLADWRPRYLDHPLLSVLARRLFWSFEEPATGRAALGAWRDGRILDADDRPLDRLGAETRVRLWHPASSDPDVVLAWQLWLERHAVTQPFKQAHREVYLLTDAERATATYSNRFAAHVLR